MTENNTDKDSTDQNLNISRTNNDTPDQNNPQEESPSRFQEFFTDAVESHKPKMTDTLITFHKLKNIDEELTEIEEEKGDLPESIEEIKITIDTLNSELDEKMNSVSKNEEEKEKLESGNIAHEERINKYDEQKFNVRSNKEYDEIGKAIDALFEEVSKNETRLKSIKVSSGQLDSEIILLENSIKEEKNNLAEKQTLLNELNEQYKQDETILKEKRQKLVETLNEATTSLYERINNSYKGQATAIVRRSNCSGCFNSIPPQRVIEIKTAEKIFTCQSCGRILIPEELVAS